jgi:CRISPR-associated endonuclease Cas1
MHPNVIAPYPDTDLDGIWIADGYGIKIHVRNKHLVVSDGFGSHRRERRFHKATSGLRRLVILGHTGYVTFEAMRWMHDAKVAYLQLDRDSNLIGSGGHRGLDRAHLRRAQAIASTSPTGMEVTRRILALKIDGQAAVAARHSDPEIAEKIRDHVAGLEEGETLDQLRLIESQAALVYWAAWNETPVAFARADRERIPDHWKTIGTRSSPFSPGPRQATNPANAILNYLYALLEAETTLACHAMGLDPGLGILHTDQPARPSFALDVMEAVRPDVDAYALDLIDGHTFRAGDFAETRRGICRILPPLTHLLAANIDRWRDLIGPVAEATAQAFTTKTLPTKLTGRNLRTAKTGDTFAEPTAGGSLPRNCSECGARLPHDQRKRCDGCADRYRGYERLQYLAEMRAAGNDPAHGGIAAQRRADALAKNMAAVQEWDAGQERPPDEEFTQTILPGLANVTVRAMAEATGLSPGYCSFIRRGLRIPHPRHWNALRKLNR